MSRKPSPESVKEAIYRAVFLVLWQGEKRSLDRFVADDVLVSVSDAVYLAAEEAAHRAININIGIAHPNLDQFLAEARQARESAA